MQEAIKAAITRYCRYQERCHQDVRNKLYELGCTTPEVDEAIAEVIEAGLLNEERYARAYAHGHFRMKQWGRKKILVGLKQHKISDYCIKKAMTEIDANEYDATLKKLATKKLIELKSERSKIAKKIKTQRYLLQKGYESDLAAIVIDALMSGY